MLSHFPSKVLITTEMSVSRLTRASGATAAARAIAPQARTEKTVEKRILAEVGKRKFRKLESRELEPEC